MSNDTGPAALAEIVEDDKKFKTYVAFALMEIKQNQASHAVDDERRFDDLNRRLGSVSSSVTVVEKDKERSDTLKGITRTGFQFMGWIIATAISVWAILK
jgi:hypothetical protein